MLGHTRKRGVATRPVPRATIGRELRTPYVLGHVSRARNGILFDRKRSQDRRRIYPQNVSHYKNSESFYHTPWSCVCRYYGLPLLALSRQVREHSHGRHRSLQPLPKIDVVDCKNHTTGRRIDGSGNIATELGAPSTVIKLSAAGNTTVDDFQRTPLR